MASFEYKNPDGKSSVVCQETLAACNTDLKTRCYASNLPVGNTYCVIVPGCSAVPQPVVCPMDITYIAGHQAEDQSKNTYNLLAPIGKLTTAPTNIGDYFNTIFLIAIGLCGALAVIMIVIGGIQYMGDESIFGKTKGKEQITSAILGLLIALGAYALLNTINPDLLGKGGVHIKQVSAEIDPEIHGDLPQQLTNGKYCNGKYTPDQVWPESMISADQTMRTLLTSKGITVNKDACTYVGQQNCTSVAGLDTRKVIALKDKCGGASCSVAITGGTECWLHSNKTLHLPGSNIVDLSFNSSPSLKSYVETGITPQQSSMGFPIYTKDNIKFMKETNHYHIISW